ncbi:MAG: Crp/Fnr family transcriptional regulator [Bacteroidales bacterium]|nr:Crp/Fnr family transcriptional regulator [Bacteroidales bacterium]
MACTTCCLTQSIFRGLSPEQLEILNENRHEVEFNAGEIMFKQGTALTHIACILQGMVKIYIEGLNKKNLLIKVARENAIIGGPGMYVDFIHHFSVAALTDVQTCFIDVNSLEKIMKMNQNLALNILKKNNIQGIQNFKKFINLTQKHMSGRIADALLYLADEIHNATSFETPLSRQDIADLTSMSKESAIRILKEFKDARIIELSNNHFTIHDREALVKISDKG